MITIKNKNIVNAVKGSAAKSTPVKAASVEAQKVVAPVAQDVHGAPLIIEVKDVKGNVLGTLTADYRTFSTGSKGYYVSGKIPGQGVDRLQVSGNMVIIGSKNQ